MTKKRNLPTLALRDMIVVPGTMVPLYVGRSKSIAALKHASSGNSEIFLVAQKDPKEANPTASGLYQMGTLSRVVSVIELPDGSVKAMVEGLTRAKVSQLVNNETMLIADVEPVDDLENDSTETTALISAVKEEFEKYIDANPDISIDVLEKIDDIEDGSLLADVIISQLNCKLEKKQEILNLVHIPERLSKIMEYLLEDAEIAKVENKIKNRVKKSIEKSQKEYYLNEQLAAIQKELGEKDSPEDEIKELEEKAKKKPLSEEAKVKFKKELKRLKNTNPMSSESAVIRTYLDTILELPWNKTSVENYDVKNAEEILNGEHYGLEKVKERILEYISVLSLSKGLKGPIICLAGPPGVGKSSIARSLAKSLNRKFARVSLGGVRDEAEIRGHRRTYVGALPGKIITAMKKLDESNPLILLDEIDKMSSDSKGDPSAAMLEVLDPEQNATFQDHYLELEYDLSKVMFVATANDLSQIPRPLLDRMEVINLSSYIEEEKFQIAKNYLVPRQIKANGLENHNVQLEDDAILETIRYYTRESGVRNLERKLGTLLRKLAKEIVSSGKKVKSYKINAKKAAELLGDNRVEHTRISKEDEIGVVNGMAYTSVGGDLLPVEVNALPGSGNLTVTGQLGKVMEESCRIALNYVRSRANLLGIDREYFKNTDFHLHFPDGSTPKDGPSAGITITTAIVSAISRIPVRKEVAMTGEVSIRGKAMKIGGLKEKIIGAHTGGARTIICPKDNEADLKDIPASVMKDLKVILVDHVDQVLVNALNVKSTKEVFKEIKDTTYGIKAMYKGETVVKKIDKK